MSDHRLNREESRARTRRELLAAAGEAFARRGFAEASVDEVAELAGYTKGAVYYNFADKEGLFLALLDERVEANLCAVAQSLDSAEPQAALTGTVERIRAGEEQWSLLAAEFWLYAMRNRAARARLAEHQQRLRDLVTGEFQAQCDRNGIAPAVPPPELASLLMACDLGLAQLALTDSGLAPPELYGRLAGLLAQAAVHGWGEA